MLKKQDQMLEKQDKMLEPGYNNHYNLKVNYGTIETDVIDVIKIKQAIHIA